MILLKKLSIVLFFSIYCSALYTQDISFAQLQINKFQLNPAYSSIYKQSSVFIHYSNQIPSIANGFRTYNFTYNQAFAKSKRGISLGVLSDRLAGSIFSTNSVDFCYSQYVKTGHFSSLSFGFQSSFILNTINNSGQTFVVQENLPSQTIFEPKFSFGLLYLKKDWILGITINDLSTFITFNKNNLSSFRIVTEIEKKINLFNIEQTSWEKGTNITPSLIVKYYLSNIQYTYGIKIEKYNILAGTWLRNGFPFYYTNFIAGIGWQYSNLILFYTYDFNAHSLSMPYPLTNSHEISMQINFGQKIKKTNRKSVRCPEIGRNENIEK